ncbi:MAG: DsbA family protein [Pseudomonadota bacterium]|nr:DsbA family protein [Pseudomonadota bacterium]
MIIRRKTSLLLALSGALIASTLCVHPAFAAKSKAAVDKRIHDYIMAHPEVIHKALLKHQSMRVAKQKEASLGYIKQHASEVFSTKNDGVLGKQNAPTTVMIISDYQCGYCRKALSSLSKIVQKNEQVKIQVKQLPILGNDSVAAAKAAILAQHKGKFLQADKILSEMPKPTSREKIIKAFKPLGITESELQNAWSSDQFNQIIKENYRLAESLQLQGTPMIVVSNKSHTKMAFVENFLDEAKLEALIKNH